MAISRDIGKAGFNYDLLNRGSYPDKVNKLLRERNGSSSDSSIKLLWLKYSERQGSLNSDARKELIGRIRTDAYLKLEEKQKIKSETRRKISGSNKANPNKLIESEIKKDGDNRTRTERKQEVLKAMYEAILEEYYDSKKKVNQKLAKEHKFGTSDKVYLEYLQYEKYLLKVDSMYHNMTGRFIANDDKEMAKKEEVMLRKDMQGEYKLQKMRGISIKRIDEVQNGIENINNEIVGVSESFARGSITYEQYVAQIDTLNIRLYDETMKLENMQPTLDELHEWNRKKEEFDGIVSKHTGAYDTKKKVIPHEQIEGKSEGKDERNDRAQDEVTNEYYSSQKEQIDKLIEMAEDILQQENIMPEDMQKAVAYIKSANVLMGTSEYAEQSIIPEDEFEDRVELNDSKKVNGKDDLQESLDEMEGKIKVEEKAHSNFTDELKSGVRSKEEILRAEIERLKERSERIGKVVETKIQR